MKKIYVNGVHEYDYKKKPNLVPAATEGQFHADMVDTHQLYYSNHHEWYETYRSELAMEVIDNGDGIEFPESINTLDYSKAQQLRILLGIIMKDDCEQLQIRIDI